MLAASLSPHHPEGGAPDKEDIWNLAICKKNMEKYEEAATMQAIRA